MLQIGIDMLDVDPSRVDRLLRSERVFRLYTNREIDYMENKGPETAMGIFCAKEAFFKAVGAGVKVSQLCEVEVRHNASGAPYLLLSPAIIGEYSLSNAKITLSISHTKTAAVAVCVIVKTNSF